MVGVWDANWNVWGPVGTRAGPPQELKENRGRRSKRAGSQKEPYLQGLWGGLCPGQLWLTP